MRGPGSAVFSFGNDGYWWPGKTVEKWVLIRNTGDMSFDFSIVSTGQNEPSYDANGDGANVGLRVSFPEVLDNGRDDHGGWHIRSGSSQKVLIRVHMPTSADNTAQGDRWNLTFTFYAFSCVLRR